MTDLTRLQSFVMVAKCGSLTRASQYLCLTVSAVSHRLRKLENDLNKTLLTRGSGGVTLTRAGKQLLAEVEPHLAALEQVIHRSSSDTAPFVLSVMPWLASSWLTPRLHRFTARYPDSVIRIHTSSQLADFHDGSISAALRFGRGDWVGVDAEAMFDEWIAPVACPALIDAHNLTANPPDTWPLLNDPDNLWPVWFGRNSKGITWSSGAWLNDADTLAEAASTGMGVALGRYTQVRPALQAGRLACVDSRWVKSPMRHYLVTPAHHVLHPLFSAFRAWLLDEIARDRSDGCHITRQNGAQTHET